MPATTERQSFQISPILTSGMLGEIEYCPGDSLPNILRPKQPYTRKSFIVVKSSVCLLLGRCQKCYSFEALALLHSPEIGMIHQVPI